MSSRIPNDTHGCGPLLKPGALVLADRDARLRHLREAFSGLAHRAASA